MNRDYLSLWLVLCLVTIGTTATHHYYYGSSNFETELPRISQAIENDISKIDSSCFSEFCEEVKTRYKETKLLIDGELRVKLGEKKVWASYNRLLITFTVITLAIPLLFSYIARSRYNNNIKTDSK